MPYQPDVAFLAQHPLIATALGPLLQYSILIRNDSTQMIIAYTVSWHTVGHEDQPYTGYQTVCDCINLTGVMNPGESAVSIPVTSYDPAMVSVFEAQQRLQSSKQILISLEAIVFADGTLLGSDSGHTYPLIKARLKAEYDLYQWVSSKSDASQDFVSGLDGLAGAFEKYTNKKQAVDYYTRLYDVQRAQTAKQLLRILNEFGSARMLAIVHETLKTKPYPDKLIKS